MAAITLSGPASMFNAFNVKPRDYDLSDPLERSVGALIVLNRFCFTTALLAMLAVKIIYLSSSLNLSSQCEYWIVS